MYPCWLLCYLCCCGGEEDLERAQESGQVPALSPEVMNYHPVIWLEVVQWSFKWVPPGMGKVALICEYIDFNTWVRDTQSMTTLLGLHDVIHLWLLQRETA